MIGTLNFLEKYFIEFYRLYVQPYPKEYHAKKNGPYELIIASGLRIFFLVMGYSS